jgi:hypothetical protein
METMGFMREKGGMWWENMPASRWARSVGGEEPRDMIDCEGQWLQVVEMVWICVLAILPVYPGVYMIL